MTERSKFFLGLGDKALPLGELVHYQQSGRGFSQFSYSPSWLQNANSFAVSPELDLLPGTFIHRPRAIGDASVFYALADTLPGPWAERIVRKAHRVALDTGLGAQQSDLSEWDFLTVANDEIRLGAIRVVSEPSGHGPRDGPSWWPHPIHAPPLPMAFLPNALAACRALEIGRFLASDLSLLMAHGTALGGSRPKVTVVDEQGYMHVAKFSCFGETASVPLAEVLVMKLAERAGVDAASTRIWRNADGTPAALIRRFDRAAGGRKPYVSAATLLQASGLETLGYLDLLRAMKRHCHNYPEDARQLWRRLVFNLLVSNVDDHLRNTGFVYAGKRQRTLAPAFDLNPFPLRERLSMTPLSAKSGRINSVELLIEHAHAFEHTLESAREALMQVQHAVQGWREVAASAEIAMSRRDREFWASAFEFDPVCCGV